MRVVGSWPLSVACLSLAIHANPARSEITLHPDATSDGTKYLLIVGEIEPNYDIGFLDRTIEKEKPSFVSFYSGGGNVYSAMEIGRAIRRHHLSTVQPSATECASACSLMFVGGSYRVAESGSIGVHKSSFNDLKDADLGVSAVQSGIADVMSYLDEMGVKPGLLQIALRVESDDMRYLSVGEMIELDVVTAATEEPQGDRKTYTPAEPPRADPAAAVIRPASSEPRASDPSIPEALSGVVRHPAGTMPLKGNPYPDSPTLAVLNNGEPVSIWSVQGDWYEIAIGAALGYAHRSWIKVDQFKGGFFSGKYVQIGSFATQTEADHFRQTISVPTESFLVSNGWIAVTLAGQWSREEADAQLKELQHLSFVPADAFITYGNMYVKKVSETIVAGR